MKVFIAVPAFGQMMSSQTAASLVALTKELAARDIFGGFSAISLPDIVDLRNVFLTTFYDRIDATHILMIDADMQFEPNLIADMLLADQPLVGALYPKKRLPIQFVGSALESNPLPIDNLLELEGVGCGVMLIRRDCIDNMIAAAQVEIEDDPLGVAGDLIKAQGATRMIRAFDLIKDGKRRLSEDFSFCKRHRDAGGKVYAVINHVLCHLGIYQFTGRYDSLYSKELN